jgi:glycerol-3-phosphate acyltransferase PlsY
MIGAPVLFCAVSFLLGTIPFGLIIAKLVGVENLREKGSGNIGATNVSRVAGFWPAGFFTFLLDLLKGAAPVAIALYKYPLGDALSFPVWMVGLCAVLGHCYSPWLHFRGGKGVATGFGVWLVLAPIPALIGIIAFSIVFSYLRIAAVASLSGTLSALIALLVLAPIGAFAGPAAALAFVILIRHESNLDELLKN